MVRPAAAADPASLEAAALRGSPPPPLESRRVSATLPPVTEPSPDLGSRALDFIASTTPATLAAMAVALAGVAHVVLGRLGLLVIGAVGGVLAFVSLEAKHPAVARAVRGETGPEVLDRVWHDLLPHQGAGSTAAFDVGQDDAAALGAFDDFQPDTREALGSLFDAVIRDYVKWWYNPIVPTDNSFPLACRKVLNAYLLAVSNRLCRKRLADAFLDLLTNCSFIVITFMSELAAAFAVLPLDANMTAADAVYNYLASNPDSRLASLLNQKQQAAKFKMVAEDLLGFLDANSYNCDAARIFLREILANSVLESTLQTCSKAEWINGYIVYLLEAGEPYLNQAIDVGMQTGHDAGGNNIFADMDGNVGNISIAKPTGPSGPDPDRSRRKEQTAHGKRLSRADEDVKETATRAEGGHDESELGDALRKSRSAPVGISVKSSAPGGDTAKSGKPQAAGVEEWPCRKTPPRGSSAAEESPGRGASQTAPPTPDEDSRRRGAGLARFTSFDQIMPRTPREAKEEQGEGREEQGEKGEEEADDEEEGPKKAPVALHNASFTLHDDSTGDGSRIRNKPGWDYLIQVEPSSAAYRGWMIVRRYSNFETLHEILRRIAAVSGVTAFMELHRELPEWRLHTCESLRGELERYIRDVCWYPSLAESEGMKRFLEKSQGHTDGSARSFGWEAVGKNMLDVLAIGPKGAKGAVEGGKNLVGGVSGVLGSLPGLSRKPTTGPVELPAQAGRLSTSGPPAVAKTPARSERTSMDSQRSSVISTQPGKMPPMYRRTSQQWQGEGEGERTARTGLGRRRRRPARAPTGSTAGRPAWGCCSRRRWRASTSPSRRRRRQTRWTTAFPGGWRGRATRSRRGSGPARDGRRTRCEGVCAAVGAGDAGGGGAAVRRRQRDLHAVVGLEHPPHAAGGGQVLPAAAGQPVAVGGADADPAVGAGRQHVRRRTGRVAAQAAGRRRAHRRRARRLAARAVGRRPRQAGRQGAPPADPERPAGRPHGRHGPGGHRRGPRQGL